MGFEVICTFASDMNKPEKDIPKAIILGGLSIAAIYLFASFGIGAAIPANSIDPDFGMMYAIKNMVGESPIFGIIAIAFLLTLFANMASWSFGVNFVADYAAKHSNMPKIFAYESPKTGMPNGAALVDGIVASLALCLQLIPNEAISNNIFWMLFSLNVVFLLISYVPMFPAFLKLRKVDAQRPRVFRFPFEGGLQMLMLVIPAIELILCILATVVLPITEGNWNFLIATTLFIVLGEFVRLWSARGRTSSYHGLTAELAQQRLAAESTGEEE